MVPPWRARIRWSPTSNRLLLQDGGQRGAGIFGIDVNASSKNCLLANIGAGEIKAALHGQMENVVCSCHACNRKKGGRTPEQAGMRLLYPPRRPEWTPFMLQTFSLRHYREWAPFLSAVDVSYWNTELQE